MTSNYGYDAIYELTGVTQGSTTTESYTYDPVGSRTASLGVSSYTTNSSNEMTANSNASYAYDYNGNTTSKTVSSNTTSYSWDYDNRLASVTLPGTSGTVTLKYDPFGRRIYKQSPTTTSIFIYDGNNLVETVNSSGGEVARYAQGSTIDQPLAMELGTTIDYYEADGLGSITSLTATNGTVAQSYTYDSFGNLTNSSGSLINFFRYTGREFDTETGLYFYRARYYDPVAGRFLGEDPLKYLGGVNRYAYVNNRVSNFWDPFGLCPVTSRQRWDMAGAGLFNLGIGIIQAVAPIALAPETGGLSLLGAYGVYGGVMKSFGGLWQIGGAISGDIASGQSGGQFFNGVSTISGAVTLSLGGSGEAGEAASSVEGVALLGIAGVGDALDGQELLDPFNPPGNEPANPWGPVGKTAGAGDAAVGAYGLLAPSGQQKAPGCGCNP